MPPHNLGGQILRCHVHVLHDEVGLVVVVQRGRGFAVELVHLDVQHRVCRDGRSRVTIVAPSGEKSFVLFAAYIRVFISFVCISTNKLKKM